LDFGRKSTEGGQNPACGAELGTRPTEAAGPMSMGATKTTNHLTGRERDGESIRRMSAARDASATFGEIVMLLMRTAEYRAMPLADVEALVMPPLVNGQISVATAQANGNGATTPVGAVLWAMVSADVAKRLASEAGKSIPLSADDWRSGEIVWVVATAGEGRVLSEMLKQLAKREWSGKDVRVVVRPKGGEPTVATLAVHSTEAA
jgi:hemolysin-activating ACP:hemolysin acyltransferase